MQPMKQGISGYQVEGTWDQVVDHGDAISEVLHDLGATSHPRMDRADYDQALSEWDSWRPRSGESLDEDVRERTAVLASVEPGEGERRGASPARDLKLAGRVLVEGPDQIPDGGATEFFARIAEAGRLSLRAADTGFRKLFRNAEEVVYLHVMTRVSPCYFDNRVVSANLQRTPGADDAYRFEININNDDLKDTVSDRLDAARDGGQAA